jgi:hypothetical protein
MGGPVLHAVGSVFDARNTLEVVAEGKSGAKLGYFRRSRRRHNYRDVNGLSVVP